MATTQIDKVLDLYKQLAKNPIITSARIVPNHCGITVQSLWSQRNLERRKKQKFIKEFSYDADLQPLIESYPVDASSEILTVFSENEDLKAILREVVLDGKSKQFIEIWDKEHVLKSYDLSALDVHGDVYSGPTFSAFRWSPDNTRLLYIAEKKLPKCEPFYKQKSSSKSNKSDSGEEISRGTEYIFKPEWGEQLVGKHRSVVVILNINDDSIKALDSIPDEYFPSQVTWAPNGEDIVGVVYKLYPRYLGLMFCTNRESYIFHLKGSEFRTLTAKGLSCRSPRFSPNGKYLVWLEREISAPHHHVQRISYLKWDISETPDILVDAVKTCVTIANDKKFYGVFNQNLPKRCWSKDSKYLFFSTPHRSIVKSYIVNLETKKITEIDNQDKSSLTILDVKENYIAFSKCSLIQPSHLTIGKFDTNQSDIGNLKSLVNVINCLSPLDLSDGKTLFYDTTEFIYENNDSVKDFNFTYFGKRNESEKSMPLIAMLHGGPHSAYSNDFMISQAVLALLGFGILQINYRGSTGMGGDNIEYILGRIGESDVLDCITAIDSALRKYPWLNPEKVTLCGGSFGGYLGAQLSGQYPDRFKAVVMRNPVIDVAAMFSISDIPDCLFYSRRSALTVEERIKFQRWFRCPGESGCYALGKLPENTPESNYSELIQLMLKRSPILHADKVKAPTLIALGSNDLRVPSSQGKLWYYRLCENNVKTRLHVYEDNHSLSKDEVEIDFTINTALWLMEHTK